MYITKIFFRITNYILLKKVDYNNKEVETIVRKNIVQTNTKEEYIALRLPIKIPENLIESNLLQNGEHYEITIGSSGKSILISSEKITIFKNKTQEFIFKTASVPTINDEECGFICRELRSNLVDAKDTVEYLRKEILKIMGLNPNSPNPKIYDPIITKFLNKNIDKMICTNTHAARLRDKQSIFKYALDLGDYEFLTKILYKSTCPRRGQENTRVYFTINAYDIIDGKKETLIDFMDKILNNPNKAAIYSFETIKRIRRRLTSDRCRGKKASEL